jgi:hypothetical protein
VHTHDSGALGGMGRPEADLLVVEEYTAAVRWKYAAEYLNQGGFSGTIFTDQGMNLTFNAVEGDTIQSQHTGKGFANRIHSYNFRHLFCHIRLLLLVDLKAPATMARKKRPACQ